MGKNGTQLTATAKHYNKQMVLVDFVEQLRSHNEIELRFQKWAVRICVTFFMAAFINY